MCSYNCTNDCVQKGWNECDFSQKGVFFNSRNTCFSVLSPSVFRLMTLTDTVTASSVHTSHSVTLLNTDTQTTHLRTQLQSILLPTDHMSNVSHHYSHTQTHTHALKCSPDPLFPVAQRKRSCLTIISGGRGWSWVEQRSKRINHPRTGRLRTATRHTWVVGKLRHLPNDRRLCVCGLDCGRRPAPVNHWGLRI